MKFHTTITQKRILQNYWQNHAPFSISSLTEKKILHFPFFGRITLRLMESRGQIIEHHKRDGEILYIATTESQNEWADIRGSKLPTVWSFPNSCFSLGRMNRYERENLFEYLEELIWEYEHQDDDSVPQKCCRI